jgi:hypothetical protein
VVGEEDGAAADGGGGGSDADDPGGYAEDEAAGGELEEDGSVEMLADGPPPGDDDDGHAAELLKSGAEAVQSHVGAVPLLVYTVSVTVLNTDTVPITMLVTQVAFGYGIVDDML